MANVTLFDGNTGEEVTVETLFETKGVRPEQVVDMLALLRSGRERPPVFVMRNGRTRRARPGAACDKRPGFSRELLNLRARNTV